MPKGIPNKRHTGEFKQMVVETMMRDKLSYREAAHQLDISGHEQTPHVVLHTDQSSVYSSQAFRQAHNILRSISRVGTPTDNAVIEAINGWIKEESFLDFGLATAKDVPKLLNDYVHYYNHERPAAALGCKSPVQYKTELGV